jgi:hypothetical protein
MNEWMIDWMEYGLFSYIYNWCACCYLISKRSKCHGSTYTHTNRYPNNLNNQLSIGEPYQRFKLIERQSAYYIFFQTTSFLLLFHESLGLESFVKRFGFDNHYSFIGQYECYLLLLMVWIYWSSVDTDVS